MPSYQISSCSHSRVSQPQPGVDRHLHRSRSYHSERLQWYPSVSTCKTKSVQNQRVKLNSDTPFVPQYVKDNVSRSADGSQLYQSRVKGRHILLENPVRENKARKEREERKARRAAANKRSDADVIANSTAQRKGLWKASAEKQKCVCTHIHFTRLILIVPLQIRPLCGPTRPMDAAHVRASISSSSLLGVDPACSSAERESACEID